MGTQFRRRIGQQGADRLRIQSRSAGRLKKIRQLDQAGMIRSNLLFVFNLVGDFWKRLNLNPDSDV
jgi:hypothetical protein